MLQTELPTHIIMNLNKVRPRKINKQHHNASSKSLLAPDLSQTLLALKNTNDKL